MKVLISIGNPLKGDDNIANEVLDIMPQLRDIDKIKAEIAPENYMSKLVEYDTIIFIDALEFGAEPGTVKLFTPEELQESEVSTHAIPISFVKKFFPTKRVLVIGIQPHKIEPRTALSDVLQEKLPKILSQVQEIVQNL